MTSMTLLFRSSGFTASVPTNYKSRHSVVHREKSNHLHSTRSPVRLLASLFGSLAVSTRRELPSDFEYVHYCETHVSNYTKTVQDVRCSCIDKVRASPAVAEATANHRSLGLWRGSQLAQAKITLRYSR